MIPENSIITGDCLEVMKEWPDNCVDLVLTDPPYCLPIKTSTSTKMSKKLSLKNIGDFSITESYFKIWFEEVSRLLVKEGKIIVFCDAISWTVLFRASYALFDTSMLIWQKPQVGLGRNYRKTYETILYGKKPQSPVISQFRRDIIECAIPKDKKHPTQKPLWLVGYLIEPEKCDIILDPFCGSGTTCVVAKMLGRKYIGIDISEKYCEIARQRLEAVDTGVPVKEQKAGQLALFKKG